MLRLFLCITYLVTAVLTASAVMADGPKPTIAVYAQRSTSNQDQALADALTTQLVQSGHFVVIDRQHIQSVLQEQSYASEGQVTPATVAQIGRMLGANYIIVVQVDSLNGGQKARSDVVSFLVAQTYQTDVKLADHIEVLDVRSGQILQSLSDSQEASSGAYLGSQASNGQSFEEEAVPKVLAQSAEALASKIDVSQMTASSSGGSSSSSSAVGHIMSIDGDSVIISLSRKDGISVGSMVDFYDVRSMMNPDTHAMVRALVKRGTLQVTEVDNDYAVGKAVNGHPKLSQAVKPEQP